MKPNEATALPESCLPVECLSVHRKHDQIDSSSLTTLCTKAVKNAETSLTYPPSLSVLRGVVGSSFKRSVTLETIDRLCASRGSLV